MKYRVTFMQGDVITRQATFVSIVPAVNLFGLWSKEIEGAEAEYPNEVIRSTQGERIVTIEQI
jgi:hypothetical protein